ncbi:MAG: hypothetical protein SFU27_08965 [Thermonemataceae bacterium]|nr:hypothetical protein [Thermonemataceae bacterium]
MKNKNLLFLVAILGFSNLYGQNLEKNWYLDSLNLYSNENKKLILDPDIKPFVRVAQDTIFLSLNDKIVSIIDFSCSNRYEKIHYVKGKMKKKNGVTQFVYKTNCLMASERTWIYNVEKVTDNQMVLVCRFKDIYMRFYLHTKS